MRARLSRRHTAARVFGVELVSLLQSGEDQVPQVVRMCTAFVERHGLVDGIYRLSGVASNTKRLREEFDAGRVPDLTRSVYMRDVHCVSSLCKQFFRDLPEPLLTYHLFHLFDEAVRAPSVEERLQKIHHAIHQLPLPHYNTLEFLISHLSHMASHSAQTNMHAQNLAIVWAPNLLRSRGTEGVPVGGAAFLEVRVQSVVVETLLSHRQRLFCNVFQPSASRPHNGLSTQSSSAAEEAALPPPLEGEVASRSALRLVSLEEAQRAASRSHGALPEDLRTPPTLRRKLHHHHHHHQHHQENQEQEQQHQDHRLQQDQAENDHHHLHHINIHQRADSVGSRMACVSDDYQLDKETKRRKGGLLSFFNRYTQSSRRRRKNSNASDSVQLRGYHGEREVKQQHRLSQSTANLLEAHDLTQHHPSRRLTRSNSIGTLSNSGSTVTESLKEVDAELEEVKEPNFTLRNVKDGPKDESTNLHSSLRHTGPGQTSEKSNETQAAPSEPPLEAITDAPCCEDVSMKTLITSTQPTEQDLNLGDSEPLVLEVPKDEPCMDNSVVNGEQRPATGTSLLASTATETAVANVEIVGEAAKKGTTNSNDSKPRVYADGKKTEFDQPNGCNIISSNPSACDDNDDNDDDDCELVSAQIGTGDHVKRASTSADSAEKGSSEVTCVATVQNLGSDCASTDTTAPAILALSSQEPLVSTSRGTATADEEGDAATQGGREGGSTTPLGSPAATLGCVSASGTEACDEEPTNGSGDESCDLETDGGVLESLTARNDVDLAQAPKTTAGALATPETTTCISAEARCGVPETGIVNVDSSASEELSNASRSRESSRDASAATASAKETIDTCGSPETNTDMSVDTLPSQEESRSMSPPHEANSDMSSAETAIEIVACCESDIHPSPYSEVIINTLPFDASTLKTVSTELSNNTSTGAYTDKNAEAPRETSPEAPSDISSEASTDTFAEAPTDTSTEALTDTVRSPAALSDTSAEASTDTSAEAPTDTSAEDPTDTSAEALTDTVRSPAAPSDTSAEASTDTSAEAPTDTSAEASTDTSAEAPTDTSAEAPTDTSAEAPTDTSAEASTDTSAEAATDTSAEAPTDTSAEAPTDTSTETPTDTSAEASTDTSAEAPTDTSAEAPTHTSTETPTDTSAEAPKDTVRSPEAPSDTSAEAPRDTSAEAPTDTSAEAPTDTSAQKPSDTSAESPSGTSAGKPLDTSAELPSDMPTDAPQHASFVTDMDLSTSSDDTVDTSVNGESVLNVCMSTETMPISKVSPRQRNAHHFKPADEQCAEQLPTAADEVEVNLANTDTSHIEEARILNFGYPAVDLELSESDEALLTTTTNILLDIPIDLKIAEDMASPGQRPLPRYGIKASPRSPAKTIQQGSFYHKYSQALDLISNRTESNVDTDPPCVLKHSALQEEGTRGMERRRKGSAMDSDSENNCTGEPRTPGLNGNGQLSPENRGPGEKASCESGEPMGMDGVALQPADTEVVRTWVEVRLSKAFPVVRLKPQFTSQLGSG
ncbi:uncharacterized protein LOC116954726 isoform X2 [Petromyzon marinus]|uniref:uncharacterized protein LOC116954726 isoform X2 n=1 Tax=Petromyzon marinus TaxID=7757 RepID=UPI003F70A664